RSLDRSYFTICLCFFFQAEDGIRDFHVTGVQTCALPISMTLLVARTEPDAPRLVVVRIAEDARDLRRDVVAHTIGRVVHGFDTEIRDRSRVVERAGRTNVDRCTNAARRNFRPAGLVDLDRADAFGGEI